jgi:hypothetical protein
LGTKISNFRNPLISHNLIAGSYSAESGPSEFCDHIEPVDKWAKTTSAVFLRQPAVAQVINPLLCAG